MPKDSKTTPKIRPFWKKKRYIIPAAIVLIFVLYKIFHHKASPYQFVPVTQGTITETVSVTGNTTPVKSVSLGFQNSGTVAAVYHDVGEHVSAGTVIAVLNASDLSAQLSGAQANLDAAQAKLDGLKAGAQPEDIAVSQASVAKAKQDLANMYASVADASASAYSSASDAVRTQLGTLFTNADTPDAKLTFQSSDTQAATNATSQRYAATGVLAAWQAELATASSSSSLDTLTKLSADSLANLKKIRDLLVSVSTALNGTIDLTGTQLATSKANVTVGTSEVNAAITNLNTLSQNIASENLTVSQLAAQLALKQAGATSSDIAAQQAAVGSAQASVQSARAKLGNSEIVAPMNGVITQEDAKVGQVASPGTPLVSIISNGNFEVDALIPETDVGKLAVGNAVHMTFDAFSGETFTGKVFYVDPAETITSGVVDYKTKVSFDKDDARMKSGLTANLDIVTRSHDTALILPQYAILVNDQGTFVETLDPKNAIVKTPVTLGIQDDAGNVEVLSGVSLGEKVLNIGLKPAA